MRNREGTEAGFDERPALEELERLRQEIERYRLQRKALNKEFDEFVGSFKTSPQRSVPPPRPRPEPETERLPDAAPAQPEDDVDVASAPVATPVLGRRIRWQTPALLAAALTLLAAGGWFTWISRPRTPRGAAAAPVPDTRPAMPSVSTPAATQAADRSDALKSELTTTRPVWVRVVADGERVVERELPADARIPLTARKTIVIRAGNAAAVHVTLAGQDQGVLGPEGVAVTRSFSVPQGPPR